MTNPIFESMDQDKLRRMIAIREAYNSKQLTIDEARERVRKEVGEVSPEEFAAAEQLVKDETPDECRDEDTQEIVHIYEGLIKEPRKELPFGHPIDAYRREADRMKELMKQGEELAAKPFDEAAWTALMNDVLKYKVHFHRKQNQLYSALERKGFTRPSTTMWTYDDYVRDEMNKARDLLQLGRTEDFLQAFKTMSEDVLDLIGKEELILYPTSLKLISDAEFEEMKHGDREIGFFLIDMPGDAPKAATASTNAPAGGDFMNDLAALLGKYGMGAKDTDEDDRVLDVAEGKLTLETLAHKGSPRCQYSDYLRLTPESSRLYCGFHPNKRNIVLKSQRLYCRSRCSIARYNNHRATRVPHPLNNKENPTFNLLYRPRSIRTPCTICIVNEFSFRQSVKQRRQDG